MAKMDAVVTTHMTERLFQPERLALILSEIQLLAIVSKKNTKLASVHSNGVSVRVSVYARRTIRQSRTIPSE